MEYKDGQYWAVVVGRGANARVIRKTLGSWWDDGGQVPEPRILHREPLVPPAVPPTILELLDAVAKKGEWECADALREALEKAGVL